MSFITHTRRTTTGRAEEILGVQRWTGDAHMGADLNYLCVDLPADAIDALLYDLGWTKCVEDGVFYCWRSPAGDPYRQRGEAIRIALLGRAAYVTANRPGGYSA